MPAALETALAEARQGAQSGRDGIDPAARLFAMKADAGILDVWDELSRILPDHTFLTETRIADGKVTLSGFSADAARLVRIIDQSPLFSGATLTAAITPDATERKDRFSISFKVTGRACATASARVPRHDRVSAPEDAARDAVSGVQRAVVLFVVIFLARADPGALCQQGRRHFGNCGAACPFSKVTRSAKAPAGKASPSRRSISSRQRRTRRQRRPAGQPEVDRRECRRQSARHPRLAGQPISAIAHGCCQRGAGGLLAAVRDMILAIENQTPFLFVTAASLRSVTEGKDGPIRAELKVQGAMRDTGPSSATEAAAK